MKSIANFLFLLFLSTPIVQPILIVFCVGVLVSIHRRWESSHIPFALFLSAGAEFVLGLLLWVFGSFYPIFILLQLVLLGLGFLAYKSDTRLHWRSIPFAVLIYFFTFNQFAEVAQTKEAEVLWEIPAEKPTVIHAKLASDSRYHWEFSNDKLITYLPQRQIPNALAQYILVYMWGGITKVQLLKVAGQDIAQKRDNLNIFTCDQPCDLRKPFPRLHWGARGVQQGRHLTEYTLLTP